MPKSNFEYEHAAGANLDYGFTWPLKTGETIVTSTWTVVTTGVTVTREQISGPTTSAFFSAAGVGVIYKVVNQITTNNDPPRIDSRTLVLSCKVR